jgi:hypothetical protein
MKCFLLQDWVDISGPAGTTVTQSEGGWLDLSGYRDVVAWLDVRQVTSTPNLLFQTAVTKDDSLFTTAATLRGPGTGVTLTTVLQDTATVPVARWFRWQLQPAGANWDLMFRIWLAASCPGRRKLNAARSAAPTAR